MGEASADGMAERGCCQQRMLPPSSRQRVMVDEQRATVDGQRAIAVGLDGDQTGQSACVEPLCPHEIPGN